MLFATITFGFAFFDSRALALTTAEYSAYTESPMADALPAPALTPSETERLAELETFKHVSDRLMQAWDHAVMVLAADHLTGVQNSICSEETCSSQAEWFQCGGIEFKGLNCCAEDLTCFKQDDTWSACLPSCPEGWDCSIPLAATTTTTTSMAPITSAPTNAPTPSPTKNDGCRADDLKNLIDANIPQYQYKFVGEGKCQLANGYAPWARLFTQMDAETCQQACNVRTACSGFNSSPFNSCLIFLDPYLNSAAAGGQKGWGNCMQKVLEEAEVKEHWNMCECDNAGDVSKNSATCYHGNHKCKEGEMCFTKKPIQAGSWEKLCRKVTEDEKQCLRISHSMDELCAWKNPPVNYGSEDDCKRQCLADEECIGYQIRHETGDRANCDLILPGCGHAKIAYHGSSGAWNYVSRGCFDDKHVEN